MTAPHHHHHHQWQPENLSCRFLWTVVALLLLAREGSSSIQSARCWNQRASMPFPLSDSAGSAHGDTGTMIITGGYDATYQVRNATLAYDPTADLWSVLPALLQPRAGHVSEIVNGWLYVIGGYSRFQEASVSVDRYSIATRKWEALAVDLPTPLRDASSVAMEDSIYIFGGHSTTEISNIVYKLNTLSLTWSVESNMPDAHYGSAAVYVNATKEAIVLGGRDKITVTNSVRRYNFRMQEWSISDQWLTRGLDNTQIVLNEKDGKMYCAGGATENPLGKVVTSSFMRMDTNVHEWDREVSTPTAVTKHVMLQTADGALFIMGGQTTVGKGNQVASVYRYEGDQCISNWNYGLVIITIHLVASTIITGALVLYYICWPSNSGYTELNAKKVFTFC